MQTKSVVPFLLLLILGMSVVPAYAASPPPLRPVVGHAVRADLSPALREMRPLPPSPMAARPTNLPLPKALRSPLAPHYERDAALQVSRPADPMPAPLQSFDGVNNLDGVMPPDTQGDIGYDPATGTKYYVQWVNLHFAIWDVTGTPTEIYGPVSGNTLWQGFGGACETNNDGDPITLYDPLAHRWLMSQFAVSGPYYQCIAISQTADPTGAWYRYAFQLSTTKMNDYPKLGVWPDGYYMSINQFNGGNTWGGAGVVVFERDKLLNGDSSATFQYFDLESVNNNYGGMLPSDLDGDTPPPAGSPNYFVEVDDSSWIGPSDAMRIWKFHVDWNTPGNTTFGINGNPNFTIPVASWTPACSSCVPQPNTSAQLDTLSDRLMYRFAYRNYGDHESLVVNHTVDAGGRTGIRWYEVRDPGGSPTIYQQGTYAPDSNYRWMGSVAMDASGNMAVGYSVSSSSLYPSVRYAGRLANDPLNELPQAETTLVNGGGSQTSSYERWGDYSMLSVDPVDDCTFWYTQEYMASTSSGAWSTRIGSFRFPTCGAPNKGTLQGTVSDATTGQPLPGAEIRLQDEATHNTISTQSGNDGTYLISLTPSTYTVSANVYGYTQQTISGLVIAPGITTTQDFALTPTPRVVVSGTVRDIRTGWPLYAALSVRGDPIMPTAPDNATWSDPVSGFYSFTLPAGVTYTIQAAAWAEGYQPASAILPAPDGDTTQQFTLRTDINHLAPGYTARTIGPVESFDAAALPNGWTVIDNAGTGVQWQFDDPKGRGNLTGGSGAFAIIDSDYGGDYDVDTELRSPTFDFSSVSTVVVEFKTDFRWWQFSDSEQADVDVSTDGGSTWTHAWQHSGSDLRGPRTVRVDISPWAANQAAVQVRFHYYNAHYEWWWQVDDVFIGQFQLDPQAGGLIVGNVYDANTQQPLDAPTVSNAAPRNSALPATPGESRGFYTSFAPSSTQIITATATHYGVVTATVSVPLSGTVRQDFHLPAGSLHAQPEAFAISQAVDTVLSRTLTLSNSGGVPATYTLQMINAPLPQMPDAGQTIPWLITQPVSGEVAINETQPITLLFNTQSLALGTYQAYLRVDSSTPYPAQLIPITLTVRENYDFVITPLSSTQTGRPGSVVTHTFTLTNTGSESDTLAITVSGASWPLFAPQTLRLPAPGQSTTLRITGTVPLTALKGTTDAAIVTLSSQGDPGISRTVSLVTRAAARYAASLSLSPRTGHGDLGDPVTTTLWLTNTGNCSDTFRLSWRSRWPVNAPPTVTLRVGAHTHFPVTVTLPLDNEIAMQNAAHFTVTAGNGQLLAGATFTVTRDETPVAGVSFTYQPRFPQDGDVITFTGAITAGTPPLTYTWNFGDGSPLASGEVVTHAYARQSSSMIHSYLVRLTVNNQLGSRWVEQPVTLNRQGSFVYLPLILRQ